jgi:hypothetical protein
LGIFTVALSAVSSKSNPTLGNGIVDVSDGALGSVVRLRDIFEPTAIRLGSRQYRDKDGYKR